MTGGTFDLAANAGSRPAPVILYVVNVSWFFLSHRLPLALDAQANGFEVHLATEVASEEDREAIRAAGIALHDMRIGRSEQGILVNAGIGIRLYRLFRELCPDIVHLVTMKPVVLGGLAARAADVRAVVAAIPGLGHSFVSGGLWAAIRRQLLRAGLRFALGHQRSAVIFQNPDDMSEFVRSRVVDTRRCVLIRGAGVDTELFAATTEPAGVVRVLLASRMLREKGVETFVEAARRLHKSGLEAEFLLAGQPDPGNPGSIPAEKLRAWHEAGIVCWLGRCEDMMSLMQSVHIVCLPSFYGEGVPKVLIEAAASGRAIVSTDMPGCREIVVQGSNGLLVPPRDPEALAAALGRLIADASLRQRLGAAGRERAVAEFGLASVVKQTMQLYARLLVSDPGGRDGREAEAA